ncbi:nuclear transport factor 2 family protein [Allorhizocola rhizosphaerae]|uniref:nuclear transport factor 2 family protein n=1 Tax=Allorhizocola rhizosphaerae TaxID=1872709 RepID=UPI0013C31F5D|nr:nuclear transport factor 2 family protein [Allorhizocola rhizosphaerae]
MSNKDVVAGFFAAGEADDVEAAVAHFADDAMWIAAEGPDPGTTYRKPEIPALLTKLIGVRKEYEAKGVKIAYGELVEADDKVYLEIVISLDGKVIDRSIDVFTVSNGKIAVKDVYRKA